VSPYIQIGSLCLIICLGLACGPLGRVPRYGAEVNPTGDPIGGGEGYRRILSPADAHVVVGTRDELIAALAKAETGQVVYVADEAEIDLSGLKDIVIPAGVTLASGRGSRGSKGGRLSTSRLDAYPLLKTGGPGVRMTGLRLAGPDPERRSEQMAALDKQGKYYSIPNSLGIVAKHPGFECDNCEVYGWSYVGVGLWCDKGRGHVHHCHIHHNQRYGLGYGVSALCNDALIEANHFDYGRHYIASSGKPGCAYEARYNLFGEHATRHMVDMHGGRDREDGTTVAGDWVHVHHNTFMKALSPETNVVVNSVIVRGVPRKWVKIHHNWFHDTRVAGIGGVRIEAQGAKGPERHYILVDVPGLPQGKVFTHDNVFGPHQAHVTDYVSDWQKAQLRKQADQPNVTPAPEKMP